jgi:hypothetical protein
MGNQLIAEDLYIDGEGTLHIAYSRWDDFAASAWVLHSESVDNGRSWRTPDAITDTAHVSRAVPFAVGNHNGDSFVGWVDIRGIGPTNESIYFRSLSGSASSLIVSGMDHPVAGDLVSLPDGHLLCLYTREIEVSGTSELTW